MPSHMFIHLATTISVAKPFIFKIKIEREGLARDSSAGLGAGGPEFESRRADQSMFFVSHHLETPTFLLKPL